MMSGLRGDRAIDLPAVIVVSFFGVQRVSVKTGQPQICLARRSLLLDFWPELFPRTGMTMITSVGPSNYQRASLFSV
jgi:hypothetical protein